MRAYIYIVKYKKAAVRGDGWSYYLFQYMSPMSKKFKSKIYEQGESSVIFFPLLHRSMIALNYSLCMMYPLCIMMHRGVGL